MRTLGIIPARGGSKGIPNKNKRLICGQPLISWTIVAAQMAHSLDEIVVTTDDEEIAEIARGLGVEVPFMRPSELAQDDSSGVESVRHALSMVKGFDAAVLLQPTSPLRKPDDIDAVADMAKTASSVVSVCTSHEPIQWTFSIQNNGTLLPVQSGEMAPRRQDALTSYTLNGAIYYFEIPWFLEGETFVGKETIPYIMPPERSIDIDTDYDWLIAEFLLSRTE